MGYTLVTRFVPEDLAKIEGILSDTGIRTNKIPYGRDCDREEANRILPYHFTVFHWAKTYDEVYLQRLKDFVNPGPFTFSVTGTGLVVPAEEGSALLYFTFKPGEDYRICADALERTLGETTEGFYHVTLAVSKDLEEIAGLKQKIDASVAYPFQVRADGFSLYHIWKPVRKAAEY